MRVLPELKAKPGDLPACLDGCPPDNPAIFLDQFLDCGLDDTALDVVEVGFLLLCRVH